MSAASDGSSSRRRALPDILLPKSTPRRATSGRFMTSGQTRSNRAWTSGSSRAARVICMNRFQSRSPSMSDLIRAATAVSVACREQASISSNSGVSSYGGLEGFRDMTLRLARAPGPCGIAWPGFRIAGRNDRPGASTRCDFRFRRCVRDRGRRCGRPS